MKYKGILFDLDGTLVDTLGDLTDAMNHGLEQLGRPTHSTAACQQMVGGGVVKFAELALGCGFEHQVDELLAIFRPYYHANCFKKTRPYTGILQAVRAFNEKQIKQAVITNKPHVQAVKVVEHFFPDGLFDFIEGVTPDKPIKPDPSLTLRIIETMGLKPEDVLFVGDSDVDCKTAINAQVRFVGVNWGFRSEEVLKDAGAETIIGHPGELEDIVNRS